MWFRGAAEAGVASSQYELGVALVNADGVEMDRQEGVGWLWRAAQQGNADAKADLRAPNPNPNPNPSPNSSLALTLTLTLAPTLA